MAKPDLKARAERNGKIRRTIARIEQTIGKLDRMKGEYLEKAVDAKARGDSASYSLAKSGLNATLTQTKRAKEMLLNIQITSELQHMGETNEDFLTGMSKIAKSISRINKKSDFVKLQKEIDKALSGMEEAQAGLDVFLQNTDAQFAAISQAPGALTDRQIDELVSGRVSERELLMDEQIEKIISGGGIAAAHEQQIAEGAPAEAKADNHSQKAAAAPFPAPDGVFAFGPVGSAPIDVSALGDDDGAKVPLADVYFASDAPALILGRDGAGDVHSIKLADSPCVIVGGSIGSGKSAFLHQALCSLMLSFTADKVRFLNIDIKAEELDVYDGTAYAVCNAITDGSGVLPALKALQAELENRLDAMSAVGAKDIFAYNAVAEQKLPYIIVAIDELADVVKTDGFERALLRLARQAGEAGIYIIAATRESSVITPGIAGAFAARIAFRTDAAGEGAMGVKGCSAISGAGELICTAGGARHECAAPYVNRQQQKRLAGMTRRADV